MSAAQVERVELDQLICWRIRAAGSELLVTQQGAQILGYRQAEQPPLIWLSPDAAYRTGQSVRGGVPVCWPWFGDLRRNPQAVQAHYRADEAPAHGLLRTLPWELQDIQQQAGGVSLRLTYDTIRHPLPHWDGEASLSLTLELTEQLQLHLETHNLGQSPLTFSQALHSYFAVSDVHTVRIEGFDGCRYIDTLQDWQILLQEGEPLIEGETDRLYLNVPARLVINDPAWNRRILLESRGSASAVLWNPWTDKARRLSQFPDSAWKEMLCIETGNLWDDIVSLLPGQRHQLSLRISSEPLDD
ncbi:D-hexose-6-phosphate mutarotase [Pseudomonas sp. NCCP-436]|uniref:D-hexose-6-phosphate mutarotase n=1 Tax=Pseudomonas sp. NCCP-436 TaxID=2842481 RepID=UPI001C823166|nr:D-hexose-6-phosphate mutarotase [Pseudomonas sp. NCCP-436]GIZ13169.1 D-hexose-6-phosphate mutarotase [Pseudomonas sp. NCCP-436]